ncbi:MAG: alpha-hydroxy acid oxidase [Gemmatimonas sp.]
MNTSFPLNLHELQSLAEAKLPRMVFDYFAGGANDELLLDSTRDDWNAIALRYRVMRNVSSRSHTCKVLGEQLEWPILVAPMALQQMAHPDGELATARASAQSGCGMILSTLSTFAIEQVRDAMREHSATTPLWFQLYIERDRGHTQALVKRAELGGATALVLTVDTPVLGRRERDIRNQFHLPDGHVTPHLFETTKLGEAPQDKASALATYIARKWDDSIEWPDLEWLRSITSLPILVKGVVRGDDALLALDHGATGVIVSNHGGRQLDAAITTPRALREVANAMNGRGTLLVDGGIRRGADIVRAIAMGAHAVLLGRPVLWSLAIGGADAVASTLGLLRAEFDMAMALCGCRSVPEISADLIG